MRQKKTIAVIQSNYIPWKGYFDIIHDADLFIFYDDVQYTKNDWRNRNQVKSPQGLFWLTIPVGKREDRLICEVTFQDSFWRKKHWQVIEQWYHNAPYYNLYLEFFQRFFGENACESLSDFNQGLIKTISTQFLGINTRFEDSRSYNLQGKKLDRLIDLLIKAGATRYISGPSAKDYIDQQKFIDAGIELVYKDYSGYPEYPQLYPPFTHKVSILDLLLNTGLDAPNYIWGWRK
jgi:hypothetical protein